MSGSNGRKTIRLTMGQALVKYLSVQYSERDNRERRFIQAMFGIFGHGNVSGLGQALGEYAKELPYYQPKNEQAMVHTASGFAKTNLRLATLACTSSIGPGATNMVSGAATAAVNRLPVLLLPGDYYATRYQGPVLQQLEHPTAGDVSVNDCFRPLSRFFDRITRPEQLLTALPEAMRVMTDPADTGPVTLALPQDIQTHAYDYPAHFFEKRVWRIERRIPDPQRIHEAIGLLKQARRPLIIAGGGVHYSEAWDELQELSQALGIPVGETSAGKGAIRVDSDLLLGGIGVTGNPGAAKIATDADLILCIGTRLSDFTTGSQAIWQHPDVKFISVNVGSHDAYKQGALPILADAQLGLCALLVAAREAGIQPNAPYAEEVLAAKRAWQKQIAEEVYQQVPGRGMTQGQVVGALNEAAQPGDTIVAGAGYPEADLLRLWDTSRERKCHLEFGYSCMGYELPAGLGVRMAQPKGEVYVFIGDGTYLMNPTELVTATQEGLKVTVVVSDNHGYQCIRNLQMGSTGQDFGNEFRARDQKTNRLAGDYLSLDYKKNAESMCARAWHVKTPNELCQALGEARKEKRPCVIVAKTEPHVFVPPSGLWWDVSVAEASNDPATQELHKKHEQTRKKLQRFYY